MAAGSHPEASVVPAARFRRRTEYESRSAGSGGSSGQGLPQGKRGRMPGSSMKTPSRRIGGHSRYSWRSSGRVRGGSKKGPSLRDRIQNETRASSPRKRILELFNACTNARLRRDCNPDDKQFRTFDLPTEFLQWKVSDTTSAPRSDPACATAQPGAETTEPQKPGGGCERGEAGGRTWTSTPADEQATTG